MRQIPLRLSLIIPILSIGLIILSQGDACAFSRGLTAKVRHMRDAAFAERFELAREAFAAGDLERCAQEASLALEHASTPDRAAACHHLLAAAYERLGDAPSTSLHRAKLAEYRRQSGANTK